jgi:hypothetical protein
MVESDIKHHNPLTKTKAEKRRKIFFFFLFININVLNFTDDEQD